MISDAVERLAGAMLDPPAHEQTLIELLRRLAAIVDSPDTPAYAVPAASRELRATAAELRGLAGDDTGDEAERFLAQISNPAFRNPGD